MSTPLNPTAVVTLARFGLLQEVRLHEAVRDVVAAMYVIDDGLDIKQVNPLGPGGEPS